MCQLNKLITLSVQFSLVISFLINNCNCRPDQLLNSNSKCRIQCESKELRKSNEINCNKYCNLSNLNANLGDHSNALNIKKRSSSNRLPKKRRKLNNQLEIAQQVYDKSYLRVKKDLDNNLDSNSDNDFDQTNYQSYNNYEDDNRNYRRQLNNQEDNGASEQNDQQNNYGENSQVNGQAPNYDPSNDYQNNDANFQNHFAGNQYNNDYVSNYDTSNEISNQQAQNAQFNNNPQDNNDGKLKHMLRQVRTFFHVNPLNQMAAQQANDEQMNDNTNQLDANQWNNEQGQAQDYDQNAMFNRNYDQNDGDLMYYDTNYNQNLNKRGLFNPSGSVMLSITGLVLFMLGALLSVIFWFLGKPKNSKSLKKKRKSIVADSDNIETTVKFSV